MKKRITRNFRDLIHVILYLAILLLFANYESSRKTNHQEQAVLPSGVGETFPTFTKNNVTSWK